MSEALTQSDWQRLDELFEQASRLPPEDVDAFCARECGDNAELHAFLIDLIAATRIGDDAVRDAVAGLAREVAGARPLVGERVGAYRVDQMLGRGGMGEVYLARRDDGEFDKSVAIKVIRRSGASQQFATLFRTERQVLANLSHPSIPALVDAGQLEDGRPYFICDYVEGKPIDVYCTSQALPTNERLLLLGQVADALQHAHANLVLHLDIKPDNILVQADGTPVLLDFGIARLIGQSDGEPQAFSPSYASPEQLRGEPPSAASDVYAFGAMMFTILTGKPPFVTPRFASASTILAGREAFSKRDKDIVELAKFDQDIQAIVEKALAEQAEDRYASAHALASDLRRYRDKLPVEARASTMRYRISKYVRRHPFAVSGVMLAFAAITSFAFREYDLRHQAQEAEHAATVARNEADVAYRAAARDAELARRTANFLTEIFEVAEPGDAGAPDVSARDLLDQAAARIDTELTAQPQVRAQLMHAMADAYHNLGVSDRAPALLESALALHTNQPDVDPVTTAAILTSLGEAYLEQAQFDQAQVAIERALAQVSGDTPTQLSAAAVASRVLGQMLRLQDRMDEAERAYVRSVDLFERAGTPDDVDYARGLVGLGSVYGQQGHLDRAEPYYLKALAVMERARGPLHYDLTRVLNSLGTMYNVQQRFDDATSVLNRSLSIRQRVLDANHPQLAFTHMNLAVTHVELKNYDVAIEHNRKALDILGQSFAPTDFRLALVRMNLGSTYERLNRLDDAQRETRDALLAFEGKFDRNHQYIGGGYRILANVSEKRGHIAKAYSQYERALESLSALPQKNVHRVGLVEEYARFLRAQGEQGKAVALEATLTEPETTPP